MKVAVIGSGGLLGGYLIRVLRERGHEAVAVSRTSGDARLDAVDRVALDGFLRQARPDAVVNAVKPKFSTDEMESRREETWAANVTVPHNLALLQREHGFLLLHVSSEWVYEGKEGVVYTERSIPYPQNFYGFTKAVSEERVAASASRYIIVRTSGLFGHEGRNANLFARLSDAARNGGTVRAATDQRSQPISAREMALASVRLMEKGCQGLFNICGDEYVSRYQLACMLCDEFGWDRSIIVPQESGERALRVPMDIRMDCSKAAGQIGPPAPLRRQISELRGEAGPERTAR